MRIVIERSACRNLPDALSREWLDTNGIGGYAMGTAPGCNTRKYHGMLVANLPEVGGRFLLLSKFEDSVVAAGREFPLSCNRYPGVYHPDGHQYLDEFLLEDGPVFRYRIGDTVICKRLLMAQGGNTVLVRYEMEHGPWPATLCLRPLLAFRGHHELKHEDSFIRTGATALHNGFSVHPYEGLPPLHIQTCTPASFRHEPDWYRRFEYAAEAEKGYDHHEDLFCPGLLSLKLVHGRGIVIAAGVNPVDHPAGAWESEVSRRRAAAEQDADVARRAPLRADQTEPLPLLIRAGRHFLIRTPTPDPRPTIIAGYPWFDDWGRDTLISLPGLTFCSGRPDAGKAMLLSLGPHLRRGLIPNFFAANPEHNAYNAVDASLWYFWAVQQMLAWTDDHATARSLWPVLRTILTHFIAGTDNHIGMGADGLLHAGNPSTQLTWMDAQAYGGPVTPRHGCAVEINALWYNALCFAAHLAPAAGEQPPFPPDLCDRVKAAFVRAFWLDAANGLADVVTGGIPDPAVRPNQIFAVSLPFSPLDPCQRVAVVERVRKDLLTPYGLRTLSPRHPAYRGRYDGDQNARDAAYHQGTVWPWLIGHFGEACLRTALDRRQAASDLLDQFAPLLEHTLHGPGLLTVPEIFDGDPPHRPHGCPAQAWSTAELIRLFLLCGRELGA